MLTKRWSSGLYYIFVQWCGVMCSIKCLEFTLIDYEKMESDNIITGKFN